MDTVIKDCINKASDVIGNTWPLYTFVASNPLSGYEKNSFEDAADLAERHLNANTFPKAHLYRQAWKNGNIDETILIKALKLEGFLEEPEVYLSQMENDIKVTAENPNHKLDKIMSKWLAAFMDEGLAEWDMPYKSEGFYGSWRLLAVYDSEIGKTALKDIPKEASKALRAILLNYTETEIQDIFTYHLAALPGWTGYIKHRSSSNSDWHVDYPITLEDYLAVRLWTATKIGTDLLPENHGSIDQKGVNKLKFIWLKAWEQTWQKDLVNNLENELSIEPRKKLSIPDAQMVFCIDTRSELIRRHVEASGNYETFGYAGFFGITMDYQSLEDGITRKSCPPIVPSSYQVTEKEQYGNEEKLNAFKKANKQNRFKQYFLRRMKNMLPSAFGYVEGSGLFYGLSLIGRTIIPKQLYRLNKKDKVTGYETYCEPNIERYDKITDAGDDIPLTEKVAIVKSAFSLMGWRQFAPLVLFVGHGSHSSNNPFESSLDCGACAASPGRHNARMLAKLANLKPVRDILATDHGINIPEQTLFLGAEHNTTTDSIVLFDWEVTSSHAHLVEKLKLDLKVAQETATNDRLGKKNNSVALSQKKANNWSETRPEWGLAKNSGFIIGRRNISENLNLDRRCFLHSYDWELDKDGSALEGIILGPMTVTQWINNHYYFSTVDNDTFGGGSKIAHNITGKFGVVQGNGGDLNMGLPIQSLFETDDAMYHQPLRLTVVIQAPISRVSEIIARNEGTKTLVDNEWVHLMVADPNQENEIFKYKKSLQWESVSQKTKNGNHQKAIKDTELVA